MASVPTHFVFIITAPEGVLCARFLLEPGRHYHLDDVQVERESCLVPHAHTLTVAATRLPLEDEFRGLAARAATRSADDSPGHLRRLLNLLIPF